MREYGDGIYYVILETNDYGQILQHGHSPEIYTAQFQDSDSVVFAYDSLSATLRISSPGTPKHKLKLEELFVVNVLGAFSKRTDRIVCYPSAIKRLTFTHGFFPDDSLKITIAEINFWHINDSIRFRRHNNPIDIRTTILRFLNMYELLRDEVELVGAKLHFEFLPGGPCRPGSYTLSLQEGKPLPELTDLDRDKERLILKHLSRMEIIHGFDEKSVESVGLGSVPADCYG